MRIYKSCKEAASETKRELKEMGVEVRLETMQDKFIKGDPDYITNELIGYSYMILDTADKEELPIAFDKTKEIEWAEQDFQERISQTNVNPGEAYKLRDVWEEFVHDGKFSYSYPERINDQVEKVIECLKTTPTSRNSIISLWDPTLDQDRIGGKMRVPCSMYYQILIREGKVNMLYNIRSNDLMTHWCWDVYLAIKLQEYIASKLDMPTGWFIQQVGSLHSYQKDLKGIF